MSFKEKLIEIIRKDLSEEEIKLVPKGFQKTGKMIIINLPVELREKFSVIGEGILRVFSDVKTVCVKTGEITGEFRRPQLKVIAGENNMVVENFENSVWFCYDASKIMFAKGNVSERGRLAKLIKPFETIVDMFVGIGYFSLPIAKKNPTARIYGIDKNPNSVYWLFRGKEKNGLKNMEIILGDSKEEVKNLIEKGVIADRVLMGYLPPPEEFVSTALSILKKGGMVHYDALIRTDNVEEDLEAVRQLFCVDGRRAEIINPQRVKSYRPKVDHYVVDLKVY